jgi:hypothetical protein
MLSLALLIRSVISIPQAFLSKSQELGYIRGQHVKYRLVSALSKPFKSFNHLHPPPIRTPLLPHSALTFSVNFASARFRGLVSIQ